MNQLRGLLAEGGIVIAQGSATLGRYGGGTARQK
jgi:hypothetical protein